MNPYYDGDFTTAAQHGPLVRWQDEVTRALMYRQTMRQRISLFEPLERSDPGESGYYLAEETTPKIVEADVAEWDRIYTEIPETRVEWESFSYGYQYVTGSDLGELAMTVQSSLTYDYYLTFDPDTDIEILRAYRIVKVGSALVTLGTVPGVDDETILAADSTHKRWKGDIYERITRRVPMGDFVIYV